MCPDPLVATRAALDLTTRLDYMALDLLVCKGKEREGRALDRIGERQRAQRWKGEERGVGGPYA